MEYRRQRRSGLEHGAGATADAGSDEAHEILSEHRPRLQADEEDDALVAVPFLADGERLQHFGNGLNLPVDFGGANADAAGIEGGVGAAVDDEAARGTLLGEVAMRPS